MHLLPLSNNNYVKPYLFTGSDGKGGLNARISSIYEGANKLYNGALLLSNGVRSLSDGATRLNIGATTLTDGVVTLNNSVISAKEELDSKITSTKKKWKKKKP